MFNNFQLRNMEGVIDSTPSHCGQTSAVIAHQALGAPSAPPPTLNMTLNPFPMLIPKMPLPGYSQYDALMQQAYYGGMFGAVNPGIPFINGLQPPPPPPHMTFVPPPFAAGWPPSACPSPAPTTPFLHQTSTPLMVPNPLPTPSSFSSQGMPDQSIHTYIPESEKSVNDRNQGRESFRDNNRRNGRPNYQRPQTSSSQRRSRTPPRRYADRNQRKPRSRERSPRNRRRSRSDSRSKNSRNRSRTRRRSGSTDRFGRIQRNFKRKSERRSQSTSPRMERKDGKQSSWKPSNVHIKKEIKEEPSYDRSRAERDDREEDLRFSSDNYSSSDECEKIPELTEEDYRMEIANYTRCVAAEVFFTKEEKMCYATDRFKTMLNDFQDQLMTRNQKARETQQPYERPKRKPHICMHFKKKPKVIHNRRDPKRSKPTLVLTSSDSDDSSDSDWCSSEDDENITELELKRTHPYRLHDELWFNDPGEMNDGPLCRCSVKSRRTGIRHNCFPGEVAPYPACDPHSNNADKLYHYRIAISPKTNFVLKKFPTIIKQDKHEYIFEGFSMFSHYKLPENLPSCRVIRYNIEYVIAYIEEECPTNFTVGGLDLISEFLFKEVLELVDINWKLNDQVDGCPQFHFMPRFVRPLVEKGKELLSLNYVIRHLLRNSKPLVSPELLSRLEKLSDSEYIDLIENHVKAHIVVQPGMKPCALRVDQMDRELTLEDGNSYPEVIHFGMRPAQLSYAGNPKYQKALKDLTKFKKYLATKPRVDYKDKAKLAKKEKQVMELKQAKDLKRDVTVVMSSKDFLRTGIRSDVVQHALIIPVLVGHLRFQKSLYRLEENINLKFNDRLLLQLALTHPSYRENFGTNPDHARNAMINCGMRQPEYGDRRVLYLYSRKRGIKMLLSIMSRLAKDIETASTVHHYERLEFLGDAVIEFLSSIHLFHMFPDVEEGGLATYRAAIVQNQHLAVLAKKLQLDEFMLYAHGSDLCHDLELKHAMANSFEALMGAIFLDHGIDVVDRVFGETLFGDNNDLLQRWTNYTKHPLQLQEPNGDRYWVEHYPVLQKLTQFENRIGVNFTHIRLLARAFTHRSVGFNNLTLGSNQRLEFLGDTVLQLVSSEYLYKFFPEHHEGHLSLLRSSIVNNRTQSVVHDDLGMLDFSLYPSSANGLKIKDRADILEAFLGALYVDKGLDYCRRFCQVVFFPRLEQFIRNQDWNDPKSKLQQCCLTLRHMTNGQPEIPLYKVIDSSGPTNTRRYVVAVYFRGKRMATASGHSIKDAQYHAASAALANYKDFFHHRVVEDIINGKPNRENESSRGWSTASSSRRSS